MLRHSLLLLVLIALIHPAQSAPYRWKDPATGRLVISDEPPPPGVRELGKGRQRLLQAEGTDPGNLPLATRRALSEFPVLLYTANDCLEVCADARALLNKRGTPFTERNVSNAENLARLNALGEIRLPTLMVGQQALQGFRESDWNRTLNLAGYPNQAPPGYRPPPAPDVATDSAPAESTDANDEGAAAPAASDPAETAPDESGRAIPAAELVLTMPPRPDSESQER